MAESNPYQPPEAESSTADSAAGDARDVAQDDFAEDPAPAVSTTNTVLPRHIAAILDNLAAITLGVMAAKAVFENQPVMQTLILVVVYLGYYLLLEGLFSRTPGKLLNGLVVIQFDGHRCTWRQTLIRTAYRVLEVNPAFLGAIPAALSIVLSKHHQRFGDRAAGTIVVPADRVPKRR